MVHFPFFICTRMTNYSEDFLCLFIPPHHHHLSPPPISYLPLPLALCPANANRLSFHEWSACAHPQDYKPRMHVTDSDFANITEVFVQMVCAELSRRLEMCTPIFNSRLYTTRSGILLKNNFMRFGHGGRPASRIAKRARSVASYEEGGRGVRTVARAACGSGSEKRPIACRQTPNLPYVPFLCKYRKDSRLCD